MILSRFVRPFLLNLPCADKDDTAESRKYHPLGLDGRTIPGWVSRRHGEYGMVAKGGWWTPYLDSMYFAITTLTERFPTRGLD